MFFFKDAIEVLDILMNRSKGDCTKYSPSMRKFCLRMQFHSSAAYKELRQFFGNRLPTVRTLQRWLRSIDLSPGITQLALDTIAEKAQSYRQENKQLHLCVISDEISIRKHVSWNANKPSFEGFATVTNSTNNDEDTRQAVPVAIDCLVFMAVGQDFKIPVAFFFLAGLNATDRASLTQEVIRSIDTTGARVISLTSDGLRANVTVANLLGADFESDKPYFPRPCNRQQCIYVIFDVPHMLKLVRKHFASGKLYHEEDQLQWKFLETLAKLQDKGNFELGNKLSQKHIDWKNTPMSVRLAVETFSNSVADTLEQLCEDGYEEFIGCEKTAEAIRKFNNIFDIMNYAKGKKTNNLFKQTLCETTINHFKPFFEEFREFLDQINTEVEHTVGKGRNKSRVTKKRNVMSSNAFMGFFGFKHNITSTLGIYKDFVQNGPLDSFDIFQYSQDHLETYFSLIRSSLGSNNNPTVQQFKTAYRKLLVCSPYLFRDRTNCAIGNTEILTVSSAEHRTQALDNYTNNYNTIMRTRAIELELDYMTMITEEKGPYENHMFAYLASTIEMNIIKKLNKNHVSGCQDCLRVFAENSKINDDYVAKKMIHDQKIAQPSSSTVDVVVCAEKVLSYLQEQHVPFEISCKTIFDILDINTLYDSSNFNGHDQRGSATHKEMFIYDIIQELMHMKSNKIGMRITTEERGETIARRLERRNIILAGQ